MVLSISRNFGSTAVHGKMFFVTISSKNLITLKGASCKTALRTCYNLYVSITVNCTKSEILVLGAMLLTVHYLIW